MSVFRVIILVELFSNAYLYDKKCGGTEVLSVEFNKIFIFLSVANFGTVPHRHLVHP